MYINIRDHGRTHSLNLHECVLLILNTRQSGKRNVRTDPLTTRWNVQWKQILNLKRATRVANKYASSYTLMR